MNKRFLDQKIFKTDDHLSLLEKDYNDFKLQYNRQSVEEFLIQRALKTTIQIRYDKKLFDNFVTAVEVLKEFMFVTRRRPDLEKVNNIVQ